MIIVGSGLVNFTLLFITMFVVFGFLGHLPLNALHWIPLLVLITLGLAVGIGLFFGVLNVFIRDVGQVINIVLQFWFWLTPIVYMMSIVPEEYHATMMFNPIVGVTMGFHDVLLYNRAPDLSLLAYPSIFGFVSLLLSMTLFKKASEEMADVL
ncbi:ABC transporter permease [Psychromonas sp. KJ10-10]|uniref:ABC transporter permease n=1 Tax=Psychromonas sp. KJ10-10 TaxID=3391823 RepID=UPI0039B5F91A